MSLLPGRLPSSRLGTYSGAVARQKKQWGKQTVLDLEYEGRGIIKPDGLVIFVDDVLPGEVVDVAVYKWKKRFGFARVTNWHEVSSERITPFCRHFENCGGCRWQYLPYTRQIEWKQYFIQQVYRQLAPDVALPEMEPLLAAPSDRRYRNKLDFSFSDRRWLTAAEIESGETFANRNALGFHVRGHFDKVLEIDECHLQPEPSNAIRNAVADFARERGFRFFNPAANTGLLRSLIIRTAGGSSDAPAEVMVIVVFGENDSEASGEVVRFLSSRFPEITSLYSAVNSARNDSIGHCEMELEYGAPHITETLDGIEFVIGPKTFFQTNPEQARELYGVVLDWAALTGTETVYDMYCGIGSISLLAAQQAGEVFGVESVPEAIDGARRNAEHNGLENVHFVTGEVETVLQDGFPGDRRRPDLVILDPPRAGMHPKVVQTLLAELPPRIIYVSCKPSTQARDIKMLSDAYDVTRMRGVDMFPQTYHIENVVELVRRDRR